MALRGEPAAPGAVSSGIMSIQNLQNSPTPRLANAAPAGARVRRVLSAVGAAALLLALMPGCVAIVAGAAGAGSAVAYSTGELDTEVPRSLEKAQNATREAVHGLGFALVSEKADALGAVFICRTALDKRVRIELGRVGDGITKVEIRVGVFGDERVSLGILEKIRGGLGL